MTVAKASSVAKSCGAAGIYILAALLVLFSFAMTVEAANPAAFPGRRDNDGASVALVCVGIAALLAGVAVTAFSRSLLSKVVCASVILVCVYRAVTAVGQL